MKAPHERELKQGRSKPLPCFFYHHVAVKAPHENRGPSSGSSGAVENYCAVFARRDGCRDIEAGLCRFPEKRR